MNALTRRPSWPALIGEGKKIAPRHLREMFASDPARETLMGMRAGPLFLDYSRERLLPKTMQLMAKLAEEAGLAARREELFQGGIVNDSEQRPALHTHLRRFEDAAPEVKQARQTMLAFAGNLREEKTRRAGGKPIRHLVHVGIGGSDLGPRLLTELFADGKGPAVHFTGNVDSAPLQKIMATLRPDETYVMMASKSFGTAETLRNGKTLLGWLEAALGPAAQTHLLASTAAPRAAQEFGVREEHIFPVSEGVGGRFSIWSSVSLCAAAAIGPKRFEEFLRGGAAMDRHFTDTPFEKNMPVVLALIALWNMNVLGFPARVVLPYVEALNLWPFYLQQLEMESLGKSVDREGNRIEALTAPVLFGANGTPAQHAFMQALHQGPTVVPAEILIVARDNQLPKHRTMLQAHALAQAEALAFGKTPEEVNQAEKDPVLAAQKTFEGNRPSSILVMDELTPASFGALVALYEHKVFAQSVLLNLNPFDQWGVELGKKLAGPLEKGLMGTPMPIRTPALLQLLRGN
jgi:glucose-6-phosphate isomerase